MVVRPVDAERFAVSDGFRDVTTLFYASYDRVVIHGNNRANIIRVEDGLDVNTVTYANGGDDSVVIRDEGYHQVYGGLGNDRITVDQGWFSVDGGAGNDRVTVREGLGSVDLGFGDDTVYVVGEGNFNLDGGFGNDAVSFWHATRGVTVNLATAYAGFTGASNSSRLVSFESVYGTEQADNLRGDDGANRLYGRGGNDTISAGAGEDHVDGGNGDDVLIGGADADVIIGGYGSDSIYARDGGATDRVYGHLIGQSWSKPAGDVDWAIMDRVERGSWWWRTTEKDAFEDIDTPNFLTS